MTRRAPGARKPPPVPGPSAAHARGVPFDRKGVTPDVFFATPVPDRPRVLRATHVPSSRSRTAGGTPGALQSVRLFVGEPQRLRQLHAGRDVDLLQLSEYSLRHV